MSVEEHASKASSVEQMRADASRERCERMSVQTSKSERANCDLSANLRIPEFLDNVNCTLRAQTRAYSRTLTRELTRELTGTSTRTLTRIYGCILPLYRE